MDKKVDWFIRLIKLIGLNPPVQGAGQTAVGFKTFQLINLINLMNQLTYLANYIYI
jgi:hypothetical protein